MKTKQSPHPFIYASLTIHFSVLVGIFLISALIGRKKTVTVFGAYSRVPTHSYLHGARAREATGASTLQKSAPAPLKKQPAPTIKKAPAQKNKAKQAPLKSVAPAKKNEKLPVALAQKDAPKKKEIQKEIEQKVVEPEKNEQENNAPQEEQAVMTIDLGAAGGSAGVVSRYEKLIQGAVDAVWEPPLGVAKGTESSLLISFDEKGDAKDYTLQEQSKIWIFNASILQAARKLSCGSEFASKTFLITFRQ